MSKLLTLTVEGRCYDFSIERITGDELRELKRKYGLTLKTLMPAVSETDPDALTCFWWLLRRQNGRDHDVPLNDDIGFPAGALYAALQELDDEDEEEAEPDPTQPSSSPTDSTASPAPSTPRDGTRQPRGGRRPAGSSAGSSTASTSS